MASPVGPVSPPGRRSSTSSRVSRTGNSARRDRVRQGQLIRCWTDEEESFLFRSRHQKLPYKHIARRLDKSELACRLHHHHMTVGRKGHRVGEADDEVSEGSRSLSPPTIHLESEPLSHQEVDNAQRGQRVRSDPAMPLPCTLPSFDTFLRDTFHRRSMSMPGSLADGDYSTSEGEHREEAWLPIRTRPDFALPLPGTPSSTHGSLTDPVEAPFAPLPTRSDFGKRREEVLPSPKRQRTTSSGFSPNNLSTSRREPFPQITTKY